MSAIYSKGELIDLLMEFKDEVHPESPLTREQADSIVETVRPDNKIVYADAAQANFVGEAILAKLALSVISGLIVAGIKKGSKVAWESWVQRPAAEVAEDLDPPSDRAERAIYEETIVFVQKKKVREITRRLEGKGAIR